jgi:hypothetical protein
MESVDKIQALESVTSSMPQIEISTTERIIGSMYVREIYIPKDTIITGRVYKRAYTDIMISGDMNISDSNGAYRLTGYNMLEGPAGRKRAGYANEDTLWTTVHDLSDIKDDPINDISFLTLEEHREYEASSAKRSFDNFLLTHNLDADTVKDQSTNEPYEPIEGGFYVDDSTIDGLGVFSGKRFLAGEYLGKTIINGKKTQLGRFVNHSDYPNCTYADDRLIVIRSIDAGQEITVSYSESKRLLS